MGIKYYVSLKEGVLENRSGYTGYLSCSEEIAKQVLEKQLHDPNKKITGYMYLVLREDEKE